MIWDTWSTRSTNELFLEVKNQFVPTCAIDSVVVDDIQSIEYVVAVECPKARCGGDGTSHLTRSALIKSIRELERELGELLRRQKRVAVAILHNWPTRSAGSFLNVRWLIFSLDATI